MVSITRREAKKDFKIKIFFKKGQDWADPSFVAAPAFLGVIDGNEPPPPTHYLC